MLLSHWTAVHGQMPTLTRKTVTHPFSSANDGASGVGVLLEIARQLHKQLPELGIDIVLVDAEDYGPHQSYTGNHKEEYWALGSQYWAQNPHVQGYNARFGILLDMVGAKDATFFYEGYSEEFAKGINRKVWNAANNLGYGRYFVKEKGEYRNRRPPFCVPERTHPYHRYHSIQRGNRILRKLAYPER